LREGYGQGLARRRGEYGIVDINTGPISTAQAPFGGVNRKVARTLKAVDEKVKLSFRATTC
jgi:hypothetical protein